MREKRLNSNFIVSVILTLTIMVLAAIAGDYYFDLNDDVLMKDILAGVYTGTPAGHNIQMLYPISAFISLLYRVYRGLDWYGIFLCSLQYFCVFIIFHRALSVKEDKLYKTHVASCLFFFMLGAVGTHFLFVQYTFTVGLMSATSVFLILTHNGNEKKDYILSVGLIILAFLIRSEMLLLTLPFVGVGILIKWCLTRIDLKDYYDGGVQVSKYGERKRLFMSSVILCVAIFLGLGLSLLVHNLAYSSAEWKEFNALFNARTELYDFQYIPDYEENRQFYESINLSESQQKLLVNYNFGLDERIDTKVLDDVAKYAAGKKSDTTPFLEKLIQCIPSYLYRLRHVAFQKDYEYPMTDAPFNVIAAFLYIGAVILFLGDKEKEKKITAILLLALLFACRSTLWMYIIVRGRDPIRITHPLYIMEIAILAAMIIEHSRNSGKNIFFPLVIITITEIMFVPNQIMVSTSEMAQRQQMRQHYDALYEYFDNNPDNFYFVDVYTSVSALESGEKTFSEKMFVNVDNRLSNHDIMGGWASKSPLYYEKLEGNGFSSMEEAILQDGVYVVSKKSSDIDWLTEYYADKGISVSAAQADQVADVFVVYKVSKR